MIAHRRAAKTEALADLSQIQAARTQPQRIPDLPHRQSLHRAPSLLQRSARLPRRRSLQRRRTPCFAGCPDTPCVDAPGNASDFFDVGHMRCGRVPTCVRPQCAAIHRRGPLWIVRRLGPNRNLAVEAARGISGFPNLVILDVAPITSAQNRRIPLLSGPAVMRRPEPGTPHRGSSGPRRCGRSCSPARRRPAFSAFAPACAPTRNPPARRLASRRPG